MWSSSATTKLLVTTATLMTFIILASGINASQDEQVIVIPYGNSTWYPKCQLNLNDSNLIRAQLETFLQGLEIDTSTALRFSKAAEPPEPEPSCLFNQVTELTDSIRLATARSIKLMSTYTTSNCVNPEALKKDPTLFLQGVNKTLSMLPNMTMVSNERSIRKSFNNLENFKTAVFEAQKRFTRISKMNETTMMDQKIKAEIIKALNVSYPSCQRSSDLVDSNRLQWIYSTFDLNLPIVAEALFEVITTPSPLICTQDYIRFASHVHVLKKEHSCDFSPWSLLASKFNPGIFKLLSSNSSKINSVAHPEVALFASNAKIHATNDRYEAMAKEIDKTKTDPAFLFSLQAQNDTSFFWIESKQYGSYLEGTEMVDATGSVPNGMMVLPSQKSVQNTESRIEFRLSSRSLSYSIEVVPKTESAGFMLNYVRRNTSTIDTESALFYLDTEL